MRGEPAGVQADPGRAGAAVAFGTVAPVRAVAVGEEDRIVVFHLDFSFFELNGLSLKRALKGLRYSLLMQGLIYSMNGKRFSFGNKTG